MLTFETFAQNSGQFLDIVGVIIILIGAFFSTVAVIVKAFETWHIHDLYKSYRYSLARSILVGLEFLVAGDIIRTVAGDLQLEGLYELGLIVIIRTLVSVEFEVNIDGRWPWQRAKQK